MAHTAPPGKTLLVVEDNDVAREGLAVVLRRAGYRVLLAGNGEEGLARLRSDPRPDLVLLDMLMPGLDGWHFLDRLKKEAARPPVIITTAVTVVNREWAGDHGCAGFLRKPVETEELLAEVRRCLPG
jgi:CheY-like chemotaxis protein